MGSGTSKQLKCPGDYDHEKFNLILKLYDRLDSNGDHVVETDEIKKIADLHVRNKIRVLKEENDKISMDTDNEINYLNENAKLKIKEVQESLKLNIENVKHRNNDKKDTNNIEVNSLQNMSEEKKSKKFMKAVTDNKGHINFWSFFEYMKNKEQDIKNIVW